jgi:transcriptional regulator with XRE-family HTH domain
VNLKKIMADKNISQYKLEKISGVSQAHISRIVNGLMQPTAPIIKKLASALDVTADELLEDEQAATLPRTG